MALTAAQKAAVRMYLGYEQGFDRHYYLEGKLDTFDEHEEAQVIAVLTQLSALDTAISTTITGGSLNVKRVDEVEFRDESPTKLMEQHGSRLITRLAILCGTQPLHDYYAPAGSSGGPIALG